MGQVRNISFTNIKCSSENGVYISGESADKISNILFDGVDIILNKTTNHPGGIYDRRPANVDGFVKGSTSGFYFDAATAITVRNCSVNWGENRSDYFNHVLESYRVLSLKLFNLAGEAARKGIKPIRKH